MRIAHILSSFELGGQERVAQALALAQHRAGHEVTMVSLASGPEGPLGAGLRSAGLATLRVEKRGGADPTLVWRLARCLSGRRVEVVHTHNPAALVYGAPAARIARIVVVHTKHGVNPDRRRRIWLRRAAASLVDAFVAVTPSLADLVRDRHECDGRPLRVVPNGIAVERFAHDPTARKDVRAELSIPESAWVIGHVGRLSREKNQMLLLQAVPAELGERAHLVIAGDGPERERLLERARSTPHPANIHFIGCRTDVARVLSSFDVFALSSDSEGLPLVLLEAMASELPVVATSVGGVPDLVEDGVTGVLVSPGEAANLRRALRGLAADPASARLLGRAGCAWVRAHHSVERMVTQYQALYQEVLDERRLVRMGAFAGASSR